MCASSKKISAGERRSQHTSRRLEVVEVAEVAEVIGGRVVERFQQAGEASRCCHSPPGGRETGAAAAAMHLASSSITTPAGWCGMAQKLA